MNNNRTSDPSIESLPEESLPSHLHAKIMRRVFIAGYGKYFIASTVILFVNLGVLTTELYRRLVEIDFPSVFSSLAQGWSWSPASVNFASRALYDALPMQSIVATSVTAMLTVYMAYVFLKIYRNPQDAGFLRNLLVR